MRLILLDHISYHISCVPWKLFQGVELLGVLVDQNSLILIFYHYPPSPHTHTALSVSLSFSLNYFKKLWCQRAYKM